MKHILMAAVALCALSACGEPKKDYVAASRCQSLGLKAGTPEYDQCVKDETAAGMLKQQREEYERMKQEERDWKLRRY